MSEGSDLETIAEALAFEWPLSYDDSPFTTSYIEILLIPLIQFNAQLFNLFRRWYALLFNILCLAIRLHRYCIVLSIFDYAITLEDEISDVWSTKVTLSKILFYTNRYSNLIYQFLEILINSYKILKNQVRTHSALSRTMLMTKSPGVKCTKPVPLL